MGDKIQNICWQQMTISKYHRQELNRHKSFILWFTGLSGSGKSTLANAVEQELHKKRARTYILDGDNIRQGLNKDLGFSTGERVENIRRIGEVSKLMLDAGIAVLSAFISPFSADRHHVRSLVEKDEFVEVYVKCPLEVCETRDPKGLYKKARKGEVKNFTGIDSAYEEPVNPEIIVATDKNNVQECVDQIIGYISDNKLLSFSK